MSSRGEQKDLLFRSDALRRGAARRAGKAGRGDSKIRGNREYYLSCRVKACVNQYMRMTTTEIMKIFWAMVDADILKPHVAQAWCDHWGVPVKRGMSEDELVEAQMETSEQRLRREMMIDDRLAELEEENRKIAERKARTHQEIPATQDVTTTVLDDLGMSI